MQLTETAERILNMRYYHNNENWKSLCTRVSKEIASAEKTNELKKYWEEKIFNAMYGLHVLPNSPTLKNAGTGNRMYSACLVMDMEDSRDSIFDTLKDAAIAQSLGSGTGFCFSVLRPKNAEIKSIKGKSSGPISFMEIFDDAIGRVISQGGLRKSANMGQFLVTHPDILEFIDCKTKLNERNSEVYNNIIKFNQNLSEEEKSSIYNSILEKQLAHFNISVQITDEFMQQLYTDGDVDLTFDGKSYGKVKAKTIWDKIVYNAWKTGDPGLFFIDTVRRDTPVYPGTQINCSNPCFVGKMRLSTIDGYQTFESLVNKKDIRAFDCIGNLVSCKVFNSGKKKTIKLIFDNKNILECTPDHKILTGKGHLIEAKDSLNKRIMTETAYRADYFMNGWLRNISCPKVIKIEDGGKQQVYDFSLEGPVHLGVVEDLIVSNCGEQPLPNRAGCNLIHVNLLSIYDETKKDKIDWDKFKDFIMTAIRFADNTIDLADFKIEEINKNVKRERRVGLGFAGWADLLIKLQIRYDSDEALKLAEKIAKFLKTQSYKYSEQLGEEKGFVHEDIKRRNIGLNTVAPTGSISLIMNVSAGIEPNFEFKYLRKDESGEHVVFSQIAKDYFDKNNLNPDVDKLPDYFRKAVEIAPIWHLKHQAIFQKYIDSGISKTVSLPNSATKEDVDFIYREAYRLGCKGVTIYRDGSKQIQVLNAIKEQSNLVVGESRRPDRFYGYTEKISTAEGSMFMHVTKKLNHKDYWTVRNILKNRGQIQEIFIHYGKTGSDISGYWDAISRLISISIRKYKMPIDAIIKQLQGISFQPSWVKGQLTLSPIDAVAKAIKREIDPDQKEQLELFNNEDGTKKVEHCSICGEPYKYIEGCKQCACGSKCD
jgi:ribonucleoside-diphosphate reductase alpha chain